MNTKAATEPDKKILPCNYCEKVDSGNKLCAKCMAVAYCDADCQKFDWITSHRATCVRADTVNHT